MVDSLTLADNTRVRYATGAIMYFDGLIYGYTTPQKQNGGVKNTAVNFVASQLCCSDPP